jgi:hypothetical protein
LWRRVLSFSRCTLAVVKWAMFSHIFVSTDACSYWQTVSTGSCYFWFGPQLHVCAAVAFRGGGV